MTPSLHRHFPRSRIGLRSVLCASAAAAALAATPAVAQEQASGQASLLGLEEIVVTGRPGGDAMRKFDASYAISTVSALEIEKFSPKSTADLFKTVPGVWVESSGGEAGANIFVRGFPGSGDAEFVTVQIDGMPIFPPPTLSFLENSSLFRIDETVERLEGLRGGPNPVFSNGQPGVTFNFIQKQGGPDFEGVVKATASDFGEKRLDAQFSGPLADDLYYSVGGFYRS
ncbi:MAG: TonB-dependent receptor, partial [Alphaproteobacteria bacterium]